MNSCKPMYLLNMVIFIAACGGGGGEVIDLVPDPEEPFLRSTGLDTGDMDGDGLTDIVVAGRVVSPDSPTTGHIDVLLQDIGSPGTFLTPQRYPTSALPRQMKLADVNGDSLPDVIATNRFSEKSFDLLLHDPLNVGQLGASTDYTTVSEPNHIATGDIDKDGFVDIIIAGEQSVAWHPQQANGSFSTRETIGTGVDTLVVEDLDGNGLLDVVTQDNNLDGDLLFYLQSSTMPGVFNPPQSVRLGSPLHMLALGDLNRDGRTDIAAASGDVKDIANFFGVWYPVPQTSSNPLTFTPLPRLGTASDFDTYTIDIVDLNGNGRADVVVGNFNGAGERSSVQVFLQTTVPGQFLSDANYLLPANTEPHIRNDMHAVSIADLNGDLLPDIAVSNNRVYVLFQDQGVPGRFGDPVLVLGAQP